MHTTKELLEDLNNKTEVEDIPQPYFYYTPEQHKAILSLLSQQAVVVESDEEIANMASTRFPYDTSERFKNVDFSSLRIGFVEGYKHGLVAGRQQLSKEQQQREEVMKEMAEALNKVGLITTIGIIEDIDATMDKVFNIVNEPLTRYEQLTKTNHP